MRMADKKPLWAVAQTALLSGIYAGGDDQDAYEAMLLAIADEVLPEEQAPSHIGTRAWAEWRQRMETRAKLLQAAAEAEGKADG